MKAPLALGRAYATATRYARRRGASMGIICVVGLLTIWWLFGGFQAMPSAPRPVAGQTLRAFRSGHTASRILLVSAYFPLHKSKHSGGDYHKWLKNFLGNIQTDLYMFCAPEMASMLDSMRPNSLAFQLNTTWSRPSDAPVFDDLREVFKKQWEYDPEKHIHNPELYMVWAAKPYYVREAIHNLRRQGIEYDTVFWLDAGSFREGHKYANWPDVARVDELWSVGARWTGTPKEDLLFLPIEQRFQSVYATWQEDQGPVRGPIGAAVSEGSLFGGSPKALEWYLDAFMTYTYQYALKGYFAGKDQDVINALMLLYPERFITVYARDQRAPAAHGSSYYGLLGYCGDVWYYFLFQLASDAEREAMNKKWQRQWRIDYWHGDRPPCRGTRFLPINNILLYSLGADWRKPAVRVNVVPVP